jgi:hypothetical protein
MFMRDLFPWVDSSGIEAIDGEGDGEGEDVTIHI